MAGNKNFSQTIRINSQLDVSNVIASLQKVRKELGNAKVFQGKESVFFDVDKELKTLESLSTKLQGLLKKGVTNPQDAKEFDKIINALNTGFNRASAGFENINTKKLTQELREATNLLNEQKQKLNEVVRVEQERINLSLQGIKHGKDYAKIITQGAKSGETLEKVQERITTELDKQIERQKALKQEAQKNVITAQSNVNAEKVKAYRTTFRQGSFKKVDSAGNKVNVSDKEYANIQQLFRKVVTEEKTAEKAVARFNKELSKIGVTASEAAIKNISTSFNAIQNSVKPAEKALANAQAELAKASNNVKTAEQQKTNVKGAINSNEVAESYKRIATSATEAEKAQQKVNTATNNMGKQLPSLQAANTQISKMGDNFKKVTSEMLSAVQQQKRLDDSFSQLTRYIQYTFSLANGFRTLKNVIRKTFQDIQSLDKSFAEIAMVTDYSVQDMWNSYDDYADMAKRLGQTTQSVVQASGLFYQQGLGTTDALALTEDTMKLATLAGLDFKEATSQMTAAIRGFKMEMDEGARVTDVYSELAAKAAADVKGIADAMSKTASLASSAGMEFETTSAFLTQMIETTQEAPANIGTASL